MTTSSRPRKPANGGKFTLTSTVEVLKDNGEDRKLEVAISFETGVGIGRDVIGARRIAASAGRRRAMSLTCS